MVGYKSINMYKRCLSSVIDRSCTIHKPGCSLSSTTDISRIELRSWRGPHSVHASSPKCRSAKSAILKGAPSRIRRLSSGEVRRGTTSAAPRTTAAAIRERQMSVHLLRIDFSGNVTRTNLGKELTKREVYMGRTATVLATIFLHTGLDMEVLAILLKLIWRNILFVFIYNSL